MLFSKSSYIWEDMVFRTVSLAAARELAPKIIAIDPWARLGFKEEAMIEFLCKVQPCTYRFVLELSGIVVGAVSLRSPWLYGPYIELLVILPEAQNNGLGGKLLRWVEDEAQKEHRNLWVAASSFNMQAISFYEKNGFDRIGRLSDLVRTGFEEILLRKKIDC